MLPSSSLTDPDVQFSRFRFFTRELRSRRYSDGRYGLPAERLRGPTATSRICRPKLGYKLKRDTPALDGPELDTLYAKGEARLDGRKL
jgi:hypothetical protein